MPTSLKPPSQPSPNRRQSAPRSRSEIEIGVMLGRRGAGNVIGEQRAEARARLDPRVPFLGGLVVVPRHVAEVVERREVRGGTDVREREMIAREPAAALHQEGDVIEVVAEVRLAGANR